MSDESNELLEQEVESINEVEELITLRPRRLVDYVGQQQVV